MTQQFNNPHKHVVVLKDQKNKAAHEASAHLACEAAAAIRTVASLTREEDCVELYSQSLEQPLRQSGKSAIWSTMLFAVSQAMSFFVIALVFWYGAKLVAEGTINTKAFFVCLMVRPHDAWWHSDIIYASFSRASFSQPYKPETFSLLFLICLLLAVLPMTF